MLTRSMSEVDAHKIDARRSMLTKSMFTGRCSQGRCHRSMLIRSIDRLPLLPLCSAVAVDRARKLYVMNEQGMPACLSYPIPTRQAGSCQICK